MKALSGIILFAGLGGCVAHVPVAEGLMHPFACPVAGMETVAVDAAGRRDRTVWLGADPEDPLLCRSENGGGTRQRARLFGRWDLETERVGGTTEEKSGAREAVSALLSGRTQVAGFILRGRSGEQTVQHWDVQGAEDLDIGGRRVQAVRIHVAFTYGGNGASYATNLWFAPEYNLFVQSKGSLERTQGESWKMVRIKPAT